MDEGRLKGLMGLCVRAGQGIFGEENCLKALRNGQVALLLMDGEISDATAEKYQRACQRAEIPFRKTSAGFLQEATGKPGMAMAVRAGRFAERMIQFI